MENFKLGLEELNEFFGEFYEEMDRKIHLAEFFGLLYYSVKDNICEFIIQEDIINVKTLIIKINLKTYTIDFKKALHAINELNDNCFVIAADLIYETSKKNHEFIKKEIGVLSFFELIVSALKETQESCFDDYHQKDIEKIDFTFLKHKKVKVKKGDVVSIPLSNGSFALGVMIAQTSFGIAYGVFNKRYYRGFSPSFFKEDKTLGFQIFTENKGIENGKWKILFNDESILSLFPIDPEKIHSPLLFEEAKPFGLGETSIGKLRKLTKEEANEIELLEGEFRQVLLSEEVEKYLDKKLQK